MDAIYPKIIMLKPTTIGNPHRRPGRSLFILLMFAIVYTPAQVDLWSGLTACYALDGNASEPVSQLAGTLTGITATTGHTGNTQATCYFSGQSSCTVKLPASPLLRPAEMSFSTWIKTDTLAEMNILFARNTSTTSIYTAFYALKLHYYNNAFRFGVLRQNDYTGYFPHSITTLSINTWYHVAFTINKTTIKLYVNGSYESSLSTPVSFTCDASKPVILGGTDESPAYALKGSLDNACFYSRVLSDAEISALYENGIVCSEYPTSLAEWKTDIPLKCFPNPVSGKLILSGTRDAERYDIYNASGSLILGGDLDPAVTDKEIGLDSYPAGIYFVRLKSGTLERIGKILKE